MPEWTFPGQVIIEEDEDDAITIDCGEYEGQRTHIDNTVMVNDNYYWKDIFRKEKKRQS